MMKRPGPWSTFVLVLAGLMLITVLAGCLSNPASAPAEAPQASEAAPTPVPPSPKTIVVEVNRNVGALNPSNSLEITRGLDEVAQECIDCHKKETPGIVNDWRDSRHGHVAVSCLDCHIVSKEDPTATQHETLVGTDVYISTLVPPSRCAECHPNEVEEFEHSGHYRSALQVEAKDAMQTLMLVHEGRNHPELKNAPQETGCMQCHGMRIQLDSEGNPTPDTWPTSGIGNIYPDGSVGNCTVCHTRHKFDIAEARKPEACASCHLGPDHPDIEIYENTKHGQIYATEGETWKWDSAPDAWEPGDYRAPTCATCHMSGIGELSTTHNISERLYWNLWAKRSEVRNSNDPMSPLTGDGEQGRAKMKMVCTACHSERMTDAFFMHGDKAVRLYNEGYYDPALKMLNELKEKGLLKENPWADEFQKIYYHLWHHQGRRARQAAMMGAPDWAHWHGFFELQQDLYRLQDIYNYRMETGQIEQP